MTKQAATIRILQLRAALQAATTVAQIASIETELRAEIANLRAGLGN